MNAMADEEKSRIGLCGLAVMGQVRRRPRTPTRPNPAGPIARHTTPPTTSQRAKKVPEKPDDESHAPVQGSGGARRSDHFSPRNPFFSNRATLRPSGAISLRPDYTAVPPYFSPYSALLTPALLVPSFSQNLALNVAEKGFKISVYNRSPDKTDNAVTRAEKEGLASNFVGYKDMGEFVQSLSKPRCVIILVKAGAPVDATIAGLSEHMEPGDIIIDGGNEWYENTERRQKDAAEKGLLYLGMGVSGGEEGARNGPAMMPGGDRAAFDVIEDVVKKVCAQTDSGPCVTYVGPGGAGNFVKMVHNGIEYGDMQLISEAYDVLKTVGGLTNAELAAAFTEWNAAELDSFLIEISSLILAKEDDQKPGEGHLVDKILDKTGMKGTGKWTVQQAAELSVAIPTVASSLDARFLSGLKEERVAAEASYVAAGLPPADAAAPSLSPEEKRKLVDDVRAALYASKICSYAQGMNLIRAKSVEQGWDLDLGEMARIWKGGCIIARALPRPHQEGVRQGRRAALAARGRRIRRGARGAQRRVASGGHVSYQRGRRHAVHVRVTGVF